MAFNRLRKLQTVQLNDPSFVSNLLFVTFSLMGKRTFPRTFPAQALARKKQPFPVQWAPVTHAYTYCTLASVS